MKIQIIGYSGSGKSTLAKKLSEYYNLPLLYMDNVQFYGKMQARSIDEQNQITREFLANNDNWVIDGNYYAIAPERYHMCDELYFLDYSRLYCLKEAIKRYFKNRNKVRESLGCVESFDMSFFFWIIYEGRTKYWKERHKEHLAMCKVSHHFKNRKELLKYLKDQGIEK